MIELPPNSRPELKPTSSKVSGNVISNANSAEQDDAAGKLATNTSGRLATANSTTATGAVTEVNAAKLAQQQVKLNVEAVVLQAKLIEPSAMPEKALYEMLLRVTGQGSTTTGAVTPNSASPAPITQITPQVLAALQQGQSMAVKVLAEFPLPPSTRILATASIDHGLQIQKTDQPGLISSHSSAFKQLIPVQRSLTQLMATLELLAKPNQTESKLNQSLPGPVRSAVQELTAMLPRVNQIRNAGYLQESIRNNGTFLESKLHNAISQQTTRLPASDSLMNSIRNLTQRLLEASAAATTKTTVDTDKSVESGLKAALTQINGADFKVGLQRLQQALKQASANVNQTVSNDTAAAPASNKIDAATDTSKQPLPNLNQNKGTVSDKINEGQKVTSPTKDSAEALPDLQQRLVKPHPLMRHYSQSSVVPPATIQSTGSVARPTTNPTTGQSTSTQEQYVLPPLPGQVLIQPQARQSLNQKKNDMAQALVSILLTQVKGALARTTLHQLASHTQQTDTSPNPTLLSFELPFLHNQQIQVFQFRIEEDRNGENNAEKQYQKRWVVQMGFDIEGMGPMLCQINLAGINASVSFWAEWENTLQHTKSHFDFLQKTLTEMGLKVDKLQGHLGIPANERTLLSNQLVDIRL